MHDTHCKPKKLEKAAISIACNESLDILCQDRLKIIQKVDGYRFSIDSILLANFIILKKQETLLDIGTGCGIIPIYLTKRGYSNPMVGVEIQEELAGVAMKNRELNNCENVEFILGDIRSFANTLKSRRIHVIVSNPPYTKQHSGRKSPAYSRLIARYESTLDIASFISISSSILSKKGRLYVIYPTRRFAELIYKANKMRLELKRIRFVHPRNDEDANLFLCEFVKDGGIGTTVEKPLCIYNNDGIYTDEVESYYKIKV